MSNIQMVKEVNAKDKGHIHDMLYQFNLKHFPEDLRGRYEEINIFLKGDDGAVLGGILGEICWNWLEIHTLILEEEMRKHGFGTKLLVAIEQVAKEKECNFIKVDTLSFQALDFYQKNGYEVYGTLDGVGRDFQHYYLKKDL
ncbi:GNAT family N-acetyltransferase [Falsibacillus albus]|nr:GNAT family N-acetyltransferase [Falsibacillus albus]